MHAKLFVALLAFHPVPQRPVFPHQQHVIADARGQARIGLARAEPALRDELAAGKQVGAFAEDVLHIVDEAGFLVGLDVAIDHAPLAAQRARERRGEVRVLRQFDLALGRRIDEAMVGAGEDDGVGIRDGSEKIPEGRVEQGELRGELVAAHAVDMRQRVEFRVIGVEVGRRSGCAQSCFNLAEQFRQGLVAAHCGAAGVVEIEVRAGDGLR